jgi:hypothetical protein
MAILGKLIRKRELCRVPNVRHTNLFHMFSRVWSSEHSAAPPLQNGQLLVGRGKANLVGPGADIPPQGFYMDLHGQS